MWHIMSAYELRCEWPHDAEALGAMSMTAPALPAPEPSAPTKRETARVLALHMLCFVLPLTTFAFVSTGPHTDGVAWWLVPLVLSFLADLVGPGERRQPAKALP